jgi:superfamily II DNA or RNA helicase
VLAELALRKQIARPSLERGDDYFLRRAVRSVEQQEDGRIDAIVQGTKPYDVALTVEGSRLLVTCDCPFFQREPEACKHIWAAIRAASVELLLPERPLQLAFRTGSSRAPAPAKRQRPRWESFLESLAVAARPVVPQPRAARVAEEIAYVIDSPPQAMALTIRIAGRARKKDGEWSRWKQLAARIDDLDHLDPFDQESIALLQQRSFIYSIDSRMAIPARTTAWWIERLARAGRLFLEHGDQDYEPIAWDDGPPWTFRTAVVSDAARKVYRIEATIEREGETLPIAAAGRVANGIVIAEGRAGRFDDGGKTPWLHALRANGPIEIPHAETEEFRTALLRAPIGDLTLPPELGWTTIDDAPRPLLALRHDAWGSELHAELFFLYGGWRVPSRSAELQKIDGRMLTRRDRAAENALVARLAGLQVINAWDGFRIRLAQLENITRLLIAEGWSIEIDSSPLRVTDDVEVEISSGIDWFDLNASAAFGDVRIALPELLAAAEANRSLLRLSDGSFGILPTAWAASLEPILELGQKQRDGVRFHASQALLVDALLQSKRLKADAAFTDLRQRLSAASPAPAQEPATLKAELRPYQRAGLGWLLFLRESGLGGCLADDMGLGKTVQTLALLETVRAKANGRPSLVVAPRSLLFNWAAEAKRFAPELRVLEHHGSDRGRSLEHLGGYDVILTTYATMRLDITQLSAIDFEYVILDESQAIKNASSLVAKASRLLKGRHRLALSGTPIENHLGELWSLFEFLNPGLLGSSRSFSRTFASKTTPPERREALARALRPFILRRTKEQVAPELPERIEQTLYCELEGKQRRDYDELRDHYREALLGRISKSGMDKSRMQVLEALLRLRQAACHPGLIDPKADVSSAKTDLLLDELSGVLEGGHRALIFSQFTSFLAIVRRALDERKIDYLYLDGRTQDRQAIVDEFQSENGPPLFLISLKAGGLGLNLTSADYIFLLDPWWNPAVEAQAIDRAHRIGRRKPVVAYRLIARDTVEEKILELQARKRELAESIISEDNSVLRKLEVEDLELLLS